MEYSVPEGAIISNQAPEGETSTMVVVKWLDKVDGYGDNIYSPLCNGLYKEEENSLVPWSVTDTDANMNCFTWSKEYSDCAIKSETLLYLLSHIGKTMQQNKYISDKHSFSS